MAFLDDPRGSQRQHFLGWEGDIADELLLVALEGSESLSSPFLYQLRSLTRKTETELSRWLGTEVSCHIGDGSQSLPRRFLHGRVTCIKYTHHTLTEAECILTIEPSLALLKMGRMMRVWQNISVPDLVQTLLNQCGINKLELQLRGSYPKREYCVQYRESAFNFIQRLLEEEGICYFFRHSISGHTLVLADNPNCHPDIQRGFLFWKSHDGMLNDGNIDNWSITSSLLPAGVVLQGFNMEQASSIEDTQNTGGQNPHIAGITFTDITPQGERALIAHETRHVMAALEANMHVFDATVSAYWLCSGEVFTITGHPSGKKPYRIQSLSCSAVNNFSGNRSDYQCKLQAMSNTQPWHPPVSTSQPEIPGVLTATVVGPSSEEIHTDEYGRIKIQFPWDKETPNDDTSSCWVRVSQPWTGGKFGAQFIPRIGSEVLVTFVHGNPNFPLVIGSVYNGQNKPPFSLPVEKNESGFATRSSIKGSVDDGHRLSFNDKKGEELLTIVAQRDFSLAVKNDVKAIIGANRNTELTKGNDSLNLKEGDMNITLENGNSLHKVVGNTTTELINGEYTLKVVGGGGAIKTDKALILESNQSIELKVGSNNVTLSTDGISINGTMVEIQSSTNAELKGTTTTVSGTTMTTIDGELIRIG
ncbi:type VI secretion system tip protein VgrG [Citrobacter portucalensis]|uniref:type VI secretion system Vgr family protein n=1 Tax=Citrobacter portucalensis TaxID=1639133 RepID=UPI00226B8CBA|nr:type VI secretion system tip protein TssI/VgrG [Citrobacter portucalensis]MCX9039072.1 type VI secretion system tip protein VgrG [Citrobacter portucalensis]MCX9063281.1 type VI secretion system tip protein VgrG [Citrobacter portucalensis]